MGGKNFQIYGAHIPRKCIKYSYFYPCPQPQSKLFLKFLSSSHQAEGNYSFTPGRIFQESFLASVERVVENYELL